MVSETVKVVFRVRPLSRQEIADGRKVVTVANQQENCIEVCPPLTEAQDAYSEQQVKVFPFDSVFSDASTQKQIYDKCAAPVVQSVLEGYNGTIFCYGQTGAGKTHTMEGQNEPSELRGIIPNSFQHIFDHVSVSSAGEKADSTRYLVRASYFEIYNEDVRDLLSYEKVIGGLELKESSSGTVYVKDLTWKAVNSVTEINKLLKAGKQNRSVAATKMNLESSRSHSIFSVAVEQSYLDEFGEQQIRVGKLNLVDLAGSERQTKTGAIGDRLKEATKINLSLSALGNVISALVSGKSRHVPYRDSKLTRILQDSLGGNTKTVMIANAGPAEYNYDETISTLRYSSRAKKIKNKPVVNENPKDTMIREYQIEIARLKQQLLEAPERPITRQVDNDERSIHSGSMSVSEDVLRVIQERAEKEKAEIEEQSKAQFEKLKEAMKQKSEKEKKKLQARLEKEKKKERKQLEERLQEMESKLMIGGEIADKAAAQEAALRKAEQVLVLKHEKELELARKITEKEGLNIELEEVNVELKSKYSSLNEEVQDKTKKLKKLLEKWKKVKSDLRQAKTEIVDLESEFQQEREQMLQTIREQMKLLKLKDLILTHFVPIEARKYFEANENGGRAVWKEDEEEWWLPRIDLAPYNNLPQQDIERVTTGTRRRPETQFSQKQRQTDPSNFRYRQLNVLDLDLNLGNRQTQDYDASSQAKSNFHEIIAMKITDPLETLTKSETANTKRPYLRFNSKNKSGKVLKC